MRTTIDFSGSTNVRRRAALTVGALVLSVTLMVAFGAPSQASAACPSLTTESFGFRPYLPECRAYEAATPAFIGGSPIRSPYGVQENNYPTSLDGSRVLIGSLGSFAGQESGATDVERFGTVYLLSRGGSGWSASTLNPSQAQFPYQHFEDADSELQKSIWLLGTTADPAGNVGYYFREQDGSFTTAGPALYTPSLAQKIELRYLGASADVSKFVSEILPATPGERAALWPGDATISGGLRSSLYEYEPSRHAEPHLVAVTNEHELASNAEANLITDCGLQLGSGGDLTSASGGGDTYNSISPRGSAIFFTALAGPCENEGEVGTGPTVAEIYGRVAGSRTVPISEPPLNVPGRDCSGICRESQLEEGGHVRAPARFLGASADGRKVFFVTSQPLVDADRDEGPDLYMDELTGAEITKVVDVSLGDSSNPTAGTGAEVQGVARVSMDGSHVYFVARGALTTKPNANGESAETGAFNLYLYEPAAERTSFVTRLVEADEADWGVTDTRSVQASAGSGRYLIFRSKALPEGTGDVSVGFQLFRYDAETGQLIRVSIGQRGTYLCPLTGELEQGFNCNGNIKANAQSPKILTPAYSLNDLASEPQAAINVTTNGTVFFRSRDSLTPLAANGYPSGPGVGMPNVYEYSEGEMYLISDGAEEPAGESFEGPVSRTFLTGALGDGAGILFQSPDALVPGSQGGFSSLFDAQVDGGQGRPLVGPACASGPCTGGNATSPPIGAEAASESLRGGGNVKTMHQCPKKKTKRKKKCLGKKHRKRQKHPHSHHRTTGKSSVKKQKGKN